MPFLLELEQQPADKEEDAGGAFITILRKYAPNENQNLFSALQFTQDYYYNSTENAS